MPPRKIARKDRIAVVAGKRSPFARSWTTLGEVTPVQLSTQVARETLFSLDLDLAQVDHVVWGTVISVPASPNVAREVALDLGMRRTPGVTVTRACATGLQTVATGASMIQLGEADVVLCGGVDVTSAAPVPYKKEVIDTLQKAQRQGGLKAVSTLATLHARDFLPHPPSISERFTGKTMGEHAELMAQAMRIPREDQDAWAIRSHTKAAAAIEAGLIASQLVAVDTPRGYTDEDNLVRKEQDPAKLAALRPVFDRRNGTITAATSSALTDGASAVLLMRAEKAAALGYEPLGYVRSWDFPALDPEDGLLYGNAYSIPGALRKAGVALADVDLFEIHEAFAAQVLCNLRAMESDDFCRDRLGLDAAIGALDPDRINVWGGSLAYGHPFAATGGRLILNLLHALRTHDKSVGLATACAAGGLGAAMVLERA